MALGSTGDINVIWSDPPNLFFSRAAGVSSTGGDFSISVSPASLLDLPGGSATAQVTVTSTAGFNHAVTLSCSKLPSGASCSFDPTSLTPSDSGAHASLTFNIPATFAPGSFTFTIGAVSGDVIHTQNVQLTVGGLTGSVTPAAATIPVGASSNFTVSLNSTGGFSGQVTLACAGAPSGVACNFTPAQLNASANVATSVLTVQVSTKPSGSLYFKNKLKVSPIPKEMLTIAGFMFLLAFMMTFALSRVHRGSATVARSLAAIVLTIALAAAMLSCGGATTSSTVGSGGISPTGGSGGTGTGGTGGTGGSGGSGGSGGTGGGSSVTTQFTVQAQSGGASVDLGAVSITVP